MSKYVLLSHIIRQDTPSYGNRDKVIIRVNSCIRGGETAHSSCWVFSNDHIGTHIDVPRHFSDDGMRTFDYEIGDYVFNHVFLLDLPCKLSHLINQEDIEDKGIPEDVDLLLIRTGMEKYRSVSDEYWDSNPGISPDLPDFLRERYSRLRCIGFDFISVTAWQHRSEGRLAHKNLLDPSNGLNPIWAIEDMSLVQVSAPLAQVIVAPLMVEDGNGGAVTVIGKIADYV